MQINFPSTQTQYTAPHTETTTSEVNSSSNKTSTIHSSSNVQLQETKPVQSSQALNERANKSMVFVQNVRVILENLISEGLQSPQDQADMRKLLQQIEEFESAAFDKDYEALMTDDPRRKDTLLLAATVKKAACGNLLNRFLIDHPGICAKVAGRIESFGDLLKVSDAWLKAFETEVVRGARSGTVDSGIIERQKDTVRDYKGRFETIQEKFKDSRDIADSVLGMNEASSQIDVERLNDDSIGGRIINSMPWQSLKNHEQLAQKINLDYQGILIAKVSGSGSNKAIEIELNRDFRENVPAHKMAFILQKLVREFEQAGQTEAAEKLMAACEIAPCLTVQKNSRWLVVKEPTNITYTNLKEITPSPSEEVETQEVIPQKSSTTQERVQTYLALKDVQRMVKSGTQHRLDNPSSILHTMGEWIGGPLMMVGYAGLVAQTPNSMGSVSQPVNITDLWKSGTFLGGKMADGMSYLYETYMPESVQDFFAGQYANVRKYADDPSGNAYRMNELLKDIVTVSYDETQMRFTIRITEEAREMHPAALVNRLNGFIEEARQNKSGDLADQLLSWAESNRHLEVVGKGNEARLKLISQESHQESSSSSIEQNLLSKQIQQESMEDSMGPRVQLRQMIQEGELNREFMHFINDVVVKDVKQQVERLDKSKQSVVKSVVHFVSRHDKQLAQEKHHILETLKGKAIMAESMDDLVEAVDQALLDVRSHAKLHHRSGGKTEAALLELKKQLEG
ncbi:hypothetical protein [Pleionea sp. CnH1-48]|uniref:hypothetical protein n=1 Tax=Pleionea sp. CnH1-48 TaxID=2954494 RepID=UPI00209683C1|nr:hypothetical protein [Pleionea sp. CnH1-48]MCO7224142.1 hypothetical protein [Pleionea sp. CnH1-48]